MEQKCRDCGATLSSRNQGVLCWPCQKKKKDQLQRQIGDTPHYTVDNLCLLLGYASPESVKRLGRSGTIPGRVPGIRQHLYLREKVDQWIHGELQKVPTEPGTKQEPYIETPHKQKMRELAGSLQCEVGLPHVLKIFLSPERNAIGLSIDQKENHLYQRLCSHLKTGGFSEVLEKIREWEDGAEQYLAKCHDLFNNVRSEIPSDEVIVPPNGEPKPGLIIDDFCGTLCADVVGKVTVSPTNLGYKTERHFLEPDLWVLRYGAYGIYLGLTKEDLEKHQNMHKDLIGKYVSHVATRDMATQRERLSEIGIQIRRQLLKFSDMERLPGKCELCNVSPAKPEVGSHPASYGYATYAPGPYNYSFTLNGVSVIIDNIEESLENVSITGMVDKRPAAVVLNKRRLPSDLPLKVRLEKYAWALVEADLKRKKP